MQTDIASPGLGGKSLVGLFEGDEGRVDALESAEARVVDLVAREFGEPRMAHPRMAANLRPVAAVLVKEALDLGIKFGAHSRIVTYYWNVQEHIPTEPLHARPVAEKDINAVVAENLRHWMDKAQVTQAHLAGLAGVSQKTISNYLNPTQRIEGSSGKQGSPKLYELDLIARALGIEVWQLARSMTPMERTVYEAIEKAYRDLLASAKVEDQPAVHKASAEHRARFARLTGKSEEPPAQEPTKKVRRTA